jgi:hypothetical protein
MRAGAGWLFFDCNENLSKQFYVACQLAPFPRCA